MKTTATISNVNTSGIWTPIQMSETETEGEQKDSLEFGVNASGVVTMVYKRYFEADKKGEVEAEMKATVRKFQAEFPSPKKEAKP